MTAIVAFKHGGKVYLAGDRMASSWYEHYLVNAPKIFKIAEDFYFGYTSSFYMGQLLEHSFTPPPKYSEVSENKYLYTIVIPKIRELFEANDFGKKKDIKQNEPDLGQFIMIYKSRIFIFQGNASLLEVEQAGVGCGGLDVLTSIKTCIRVLEACKEDYLQDFGVKTIILEAFQSCANVMGGVSPVHDVLVIEEIKNV